MLKKKLISAVTCFALLTSLLSPAIVLAEDAGLSDNSGTPEGTKNYVSDASYKDFGLTGVTDKSQQPKDFTQNAADPLANYTPMDLSELYVASANRHYPYTGQAQILKGPEKFTGDNIKLDNLKEEAHKNYSSSDHYQAQNAVSMLYDSKSGENTFQKGIAESTLYTREDPNHHYQVMSFMRLTTYDKDMNVLDSREYSLADPAGPSNSDWVNNVEADSALGLMALSAGSYYFDLAPALAFYVPSNAYWGPYIIIATLDQHGKINERQRIYLKDLDQSAFGDFAYHDWQLPVVNLATTSISGCDDLVINASLPVKNSNGYDKRFQRSVSSIYSYANTVPNGKYEMVKIFDIPHESGYTGMRFASACDTDLNGNGVNELVIAGHVNYSKSYYDCGYMVGDSNMVQMVTWNSGYQYVWSSPQTVHKINDVYVGKEMLEPAALSAGRYFSEDPKDYLFLEGVTFKFNKDFPATADTEADYFKNNALTDIHSISLGGTRNKFISRAVTSCFAKDRYGTEQTVVVSGAIEAYTNYHIDYDVSWVHGKGVPKNTELSQTKSDTGYIDNRGENFDGTFLTITDVNFDDDTVYFKYKGKQSGWSAPTSLAVLSPTPHYNELLGIDDYKSGEVSFRISSSHGSGTEGDWNVGGGVNMGVEVTGGVGVFGNEATIGGAFSDQLMLSYVGSVFSSNNITTSLTYTADSDTANVVCIASPVTSYLYDVWIPEYTITQELLDNYKKNTGEDLTGYKVGDKAGGMFETYSIDNVYDPQYSLITVDQYNKAAEGAEPTGNNAGIKKINTAEIFGDHFVPGAPDTYPKELSDIPNVADHSYNKGGKHAVTSGGSSITFDIDQEQTQEYKNGFNLDFSAELDLVASADISFLLAINAEGRIGLDFTAGGGASWINSTAHGKGVGATVNALPKAANAYTFEVAPAMWRSTALEKNKDGKNPYVLGFLTEEAENAPPTLPDMWIYDTQLAPDSETSSVTLCWDEANTTRKAGLFELYMIARDGTALSKGTTTDNMITVKDLEPGEIYTFQLRAYKDRSKANPSVLGKMLNATTQPTSHPDISAQPRDCETNVGKTALFNVAVTGETTPPRHMYQWEKFTFNEDSFLGNWERQGEPSNSNEFRIENAQSEDNNTKIRVIVYDNNLTNGIYPMAYSKEARLTVVPAATTQSDNTTSSQPQLNLQVGDTANVGEEDMLQRGEDGGSYPIKIDGFDGVQLPADAWTYLLFIDSDENVRLMEKNLSTDGTSFNIDLDSCFSEPDALKEGRTQVVGVYTGNRLSGNEDEQLAALNQFLHGDSTKLQQTQESAPETSVANTYPPSFATAVINYHSVDLDSNSIKLDYETGRGRNNPLNIKRLTWATPRFTLQLAEIRGGEFTGWFADSEHTSAVDTVGPVPPAKIQALLHAAYENTAYPITYHMDGGANHPDNPGSYTIESPSLYLNAPEKPGYRFMGWYTDYELQNAIDSIGHGSTGGLELYAKWELIHYNIYYTAGAGELPSGNPDTYTIHDAVSLTPPLYAEGNGAWYRDNACTQLFEGQPAGAAGTLVLYGKENQQPGPSPSPDPNSGDKPANDPSKGVSTGYLPDNQLWIILTAFGAAAVIILAIWQYKKKHQHS